MTSEFLNKKILITGAYKTVENEIMKKVKSKCPEPPKTLPKTKVMIDKYEDEDNKDPIKKEELLKERRKLELEKIKEKAKQRKEDLKRFATKQKLGKNRLKKEEKEIPEYKPHELIDKYKQKVAYDTRAEMIKKENELYKQIEKKKKDEDEDAKRSGTETGRINSLHKRIKNKKSLSRTTKKLSKTKTSNY